MTATCGFTGGPAYLWPVYDEFPRIEAAFQAALDESLQPRSPELLYELVKAWSYPRPRSSSTSGAATAGTPTASRSASASPSSGSTRTFPTSRRRRFVLGVAEALPVEDGAAALVWCRDVLAHVADLEQAYAEFRRVLREGGRALVYQMFATDRLEPREAEWLWRALELAQGSGDPARTEAAIAAAGLRVEERIELTERVGEWSEEQSGAVGRRLLHAARLLREPERYRERFGEAAYEIMLGDCLWQVYAMLGKLERRVYLLARR
jgi:SAM-dependent methyltransferase